MYKMSRSAKRPARMIKSENERRKMDIISSFPALSETAVSSLQKQGREGERS
jgi:hypothetical protein